MFSVPFVCGKRLYGLINVVLLAVPHAPMTTLSAAQQRNIKEGVL